MTSWKQNERDFAKWATEWIARKDIDIEIRRNAANLNADDRTKNSDVDLPVPDLVRPLSHLLKGITAELTRYSSGLDKIYRLYNERKGNNKLHILRLHRENDLYIMDLPTFEAWFDYQFASEQLPLSLPPYDITSCTHIKVPELIHSKRQQSLRYGRTKHMLPIVVVRKPRMKQLVIVCPDDWSDLVQSLLDNA